MPVAPASSRAGTATACPLRSRRWRACRAPRAPPWNRAKFASMPGSCACGRADGPAPFHPAWLGPPRALISPRSGTPPFVRDATAAARTRAIDTIDRQRAEFKSWAVLGDWDAPYRTLGALGVADSWCAGATEKRSTPRARGPWRPQIRPTRLRNCASLAEWWMLGSSTATSSLCTGRRPHGAAHPRAPAVAGPSAKPRRLGPIRSAPLRLPPRPDRPAAQDRTRRGRARVQRPAPERLGLRAAARPRPR